MSNKRAAPLELLRGLRQCKIFRLLDVGMDIGYKAIKRYKEMGHDGYRPGSDRKRAPSTRSPIVNQESNAAESEGLHEKNRP